jgi:hypothetical protein
MADIKATSLGGVPKGTTSQRPTSPAIGDVFYNGTLGCLEIYTSQGWVANSAPPGIPTIGTVTYSATGKEYNNASASVAFSPGEGGGLPNLYRATSTPGGYSGTGTSSPITVSGLQSATAYTFSVTGTNNFGTSAGSTNSNSITANTVPQAPTIGTLSYLSSTSLSLAFTAASSGGASITNYKYSTDGVNYTAFSPEQTTSPLTFSGLTPNQFYSFYLKAVNSNGDSSASSLSNSTFTGPTITGGTLTSDATYYYRTFTGNGTLGVSGASLTSDVLTVAGGGAGGWDVGGGGGAGGLTYSTSITMPVSQYNIVIGAGGASPTVGGGTASSGASTSVSGSGFSTITAIGGGGGGNYAGGTGANGGSGGGGAGYSGGQLAGGSTSQGSGSNYTGYGSAGGAGRADLYGNGATGGGGGGAGGAGSASINNISGAADGGAGRTYFASTYAAGGKGGGDNFGGHVSGASNTGNGGDGAGLNNIGAAGGSGVVIFRYTRSQVGG